MKPGDIVKIVSYSDWIVKAGLGSLLGQTHTLKAPYTPGAVYEWVSGNTWYLDNGYWAPEACMQLIRAAPIEASQEKGNNMLFAVAILKTPKGNGAPEEIVVPSQEISAVDATTATAFVSAEQAEAIQAIRKEGAKIRILTRQLG